MIADRVLEALRLEAGHDPRVLRVVLSRPEVRNAFDDILIRELTGIFLEAAQDPDIRVLILEGNGKAFCAGADLNWMAKMVSFGLDDNRRDSAALAELFRVIDSCPKPVIAKVHGAALGGGTGLVAVCDVAVAAEGTIFGTTEVRLGLIPSVISPYVVRKIGESHARVWFLTGERVTAREALQAGLIHHVVPEELLEDETARFASSLLLGGPEAQALSKQLACSVMREPLVTLIPRTVEWIAARRVSQEGQEGMRAFLDRKSPSWTGHK